MLRLAIDSLPLKADMVRSTDYSGLQLFGLENRPFKNAIIESRISPHRAIFTLGDFKWSNGKPITPQNYESGFYEMIFNFPNLQRLLKPYLKSLVCKGDMLAMEFYREFPASALVSLPNWVPKSKNVEAKSGNFLLDRVENSWQLLKHGEVVGLVRLISSPCENKRLFDEGQLDFSADTAIGFSDINGTEISTDTGLTAILNLSRLLDSDRAQTLVYDLSYIQFPMPFSRHWLPIKCQKPTPSILKRTNLILAYDDFYPNWELCQFLQKYLQRLGWSVDLLVDNYYRPEVSSDAKLMIVRPLANHSLFEAIMYKLMPSAVPLLRVPSLYWTRRPGCANPLLEVFK